jgi:hypothetical protein
MDMAFACSAGPDFSILNILLLLEVVTSILFFVLRGRLSALMAISVPWLFPTLVVLADPTSLAVILLIPLPFVMWMHVPFWEYGEKERTPSNPLPASPYHGPVR